MMNSCMKIIYSTLLLDHHDIASIMRAFAIINFQMTGCIPANALVNSLAHSSIQVGI